MFTDFIAAVQIASVTSAITNVGYAIQSMTFREIIDIGVVAGAIYIVLLFVKQTKSYFVVSVSLILLFLSLISENLNLSLTRSILQPLSTITFIVIAIVFQREIRRFFKWIFMGQKDLFSSTKQISKGSAGEISDALLEMAKQKIGGILIFTGKQEIDDLIEGGQRLGGDITKEIILSIFDTNSAGHDGAIIIENDSIKQFGVHLPLARDYSNYRKAGTRHRASAGITEDTDSIALTVSEERGVITMFREGKIELIVTPGNTKDEEKLNEILKTLTGETDPKSRSFWNYFFAHNLKTKLAAILAAFVLWLALFVQTGIIRKEYTVPLSFQLLPSSIEVDNQSSKRLINITLEGKSRDINTLDASKLEVRIDAKDFTPGIKRIEILPSMVTVPSYILVSDIDPENLSITFKEKASASSGINSPAPEND